MSAGLASRAARIAAARPVLLGGLLLFGTTAGLVIANALGGQHGTHPKPMLVTRPAAAVPTVLAARPADAASPTVREVQMRLAALGYYRGAVDGRTGPATDAAVRAFQIAAGIEADGLSSPRLLSRIRQAGADTGAPARPPQAAASVAEVFADEATGAIAVPARTGDELVRRIQNGLKAAKVAEIDADGVLGERTRAAIRTFQALHGLEVTGNPSERLLQRLSHEGTVR